tara:strand:- start:979 stop:1212 length:234 start_codon:yes stop_codon:yes gene_type:complete
LAKTIIKIMTQSTGRRNNKDTFYVVTREGRRAWPKDYWTIDEAKAHAESLIDALKSFKDRNANKIVVVETTDPLSIQ